MRRSSCVFFFPFCFFFFRSRGPCLSPSSSKFCFTIGFLGLLISSGILSSSWSAHLQIHDFFALRWLFGSTAYYYWSDLGFAWPGRIHQPDFFQSSRKGWIGLHPNVTALLNVFYVEFTSLSDEQSNDALKMNPFSACCMNLNWILSTIGMIFLTKIHMVACGQSHWKFTGVQNERNIVFFVGGRKLLELSRIIAAAWW